MENTADSIRVPVRIVSHGHRTEGRAYCVTVKKIRVGIVFGGRSAEHEVSLQSAKNVLEALDREKYDPVLIGIDREGRWRLDEQTRTLFESARPLPNLTADSPREVALVARGEQSRLLDLSNDTELGKLDVVFPVLHGPYGEDGSVQGLCRLANMPCVGAGYSRLRGWNGQGRHEAPPAGGGHPDRTVRDRASRESPGRISPR